MCPEPVDVRSFHSRSVVLTWSSELQLDLMFRRCLLELARGSAQIVHLVLLRLFPLDTRWEEDGLARAS